MFTRQKFLIIAITTVFIGSFAVSVMAGPGPSSTPTPTPQRTESRTERETRMGRMWKSERERRQIIEEWRRREAVMTHHGETIRIFTFAMFLENLHKMYFWMLNVFFSL